MRIDKFDIIGLHGKFTIKGKLDEHVNILVGNNGAFKSSLLDILYSILHNRKMLKKYQLESAIVDLSDPVASIAYRSIDGTITEIQQRAKEEDKVADMLEQLKKQMPIEQLPDVKIGLEQYGYSLNGAGSSEAEIESHIHTDFISTFDVKEGGNDKQSLLDAKLEKLQSDYSYYLSDLAKSMTDVIGSEGSISKERFDEINKLKNKMIRYVNDSFAKTGKKLVPDQGKLAFQFSDGKTIECENLSAGEKQLMIMLLTVLLEKEEKFIVFLDEPEISLHVDWQYNLIDMLTSLNPNAQFVLTTHSPGIFANGWGDKIVYMEDITSEA